MIFLLLALLQSSRSQAASLVTMNFKASAAVKICEPFDGQRVCNVNAHLLGEEIEPLTEFKDAMGGTYYRGEFKSSTVFGSRTVYMRVVFSPSSIFPGFYDFNYAVGFAADGSDAASGVIELKGGQSVPSVMLDGAEIKSGENTISAEMNLDSVEIKEL